MYTIISGALLLLIAVLAYILVVNIANMNAKKGRQLLSTYLSEQEEQAQQSNKLKNILNRFGILEYLSPNHIMSESEKIGKPITKRSFISSFLLGTVLGIVVMFVYFKPVIFLLPIAIVGGFIAVNIRLHNNKKQYITEMDSKISIYMSSLSNALATHGNLKGAIQSILPALEFPVKDDLEYALTQLQDGKSVKESFSKMSDAYQQKEMRLFHHQLDVIMTTGISDVESLRKIANKMKNKDIYKRRLQTAHKSHFKIWRAFVVMSLSAPFLFLVGSSDNFNLVMNHIASSIVFALTFILIFVTWRKLEELEVFDPTNANGTEGRGIR
ncbi:type II secretion system F family protein [Terribacillus saccharophilus]|uniref:type II secretion system F family protein n=1 Tax=Terribacillus saccharophilus TaxID=361277 RepID=UPI002989A297|nr:hypothetical protein [Terribacillus saccharophilus]MCM3227705.1 hypothetical protein [Terribacillus saccharophilus]